ncbi:MAG: hypothetical protein JWP34_2160 [Massilia sp.]|nr:hypothetical protein [Massilia sp.]MDB5908046.1 hypothetical protein [Massilia sp.]
MLNLRRGVFVFRTLSMGSGLRRKSFLPMAGTTVWVLVNQSVLFDQKLNQLRSLAFGFRNRLFG